MMNPFFIGEKKIQVPIIQGGMGIAVSLSGLASAVANEGGVGVISCAGLGLVYKQTPGDYFKNCIIGLREEIKKTKKKTKGIIGVNIMVALSNFSDMVRTSISEKIDIIFSGAGLPFDLPSYLTSESQTALVPIISSARAAQIICKKWSNSYHYLPDALVVEGPKAGGHLGFKRSQIEDEAHALEKIIPEVISVVDQYKSQKNIPVIAAGGLSTGEDIHHFIKLGATAAQFGSIFVTTIECDASDIFKQVYINASKKDIIIIDSPVGMPGRAINGDFIKKIKIGTEKPKSCPFHCIKTCDYTKSPYCIIKVLYNASKGQMDKGYAFAGANAYLEKKINTVKEVFEKLKFEYGKANFFSGYGKNLDKK